MLILLESNKVRESNSSKKKLESDHDKIEIEQQTISRVINMSKAALTTNLRRTHYYSISLDISFF